MSNLGLGLDPFQVSEYYALVDPFETKSVTFSDVIGLLTT